MKSDKFFDATNSLIIGSGLTILGILIIIGREVLYSSIINLFLIAILFLSMKQFINYFMGKKKEQKINFTRCFLNLLFCLVLSFFKDIPLSILPIVFGFYLLLNAIIKFVNYIILFKSKANGRLTELLLSLFYFIFSIPIIFSPLKNLSIVLLVIGIYILLLGINYIIDFITYLIPNRIKTNIRNKIRISLPTFIEAIIPYTVLTEINYLLDKEKYDNPIAIQSKDDNVEVDVEVFVHISNRGFNRMGHVDFCYNDTVISYGSYDDASLRCFNMLGDGVLFVTNRSKYIPFCIEHSKKTIFAFGLKLSETKKKEVEKVIRKIFTDTYTWNPPYVEAKKSNKRISKKNYRDYASCLYQVTNAKFFKPTKGRFKNYFVLGNNCCRLADSIIGKKGIDLLRMTGIITPGAYYEYLNREYQKKNSFVITRKIYNSNNIDKKTIQEIFKGFSR